MTRPFRATSALSTLPMGLSSSVGSAYRMTPPAGADDDLLGEGQDEGLGLGQFAGLQELAHILCEGGDGVGAVQEPAVSAPGAPAPPRRQSLTFSCAPGAP